MSAIGTPCILLSAAGVQRRDDEGLVLLTPILALLPPADLIPEGGIRSPRSIRSIGMGNGSAPLLIRLLHLPPLARRGLESTKLRRSLTGIGPLIEKLFLLLISPVVATVMMMWYQFMSETMTLMISSLIELFLLLPRIRPILQIPRINSHLRRQ